LQVKIAHARKPPRVRKDVLKTLPPPQLTAGYNVVYVGNLAFEATAEDIKAHFADCKVSKVRGSAL
jgi:hypothetical protein